MYGQGFLDFMTKVMFWEVFLVSKSESFKATEWQSAKEAKMQSYIVTKLRRVKFILVLRYIYETSSNF